MHICMTTGAAALAVGMLFDMLGMVGSCGQSLHNDYICCMAQFLLHLFHHSESCKAYYHYVIDVSWKKVLKCVCLHQEVDILTSVTRW